MAGAGSGIAMTMTSPNAVMSEALQMLEVQEVDTVRQFLRTINVSNDTVVVDQGSNKTVAFMSASSVAGQGGTLLIGFAAESSQTITIKASTLAQVAGNTSVILTVSKVNPHLYATIDNSSKQKQGPKAVSPLVSITLFDKFSAPLPVKGLQEPFTLTLQTDATPGAFCAFWDVKNGKWSTEGIEQVISDRKCAPIHLFVGLVTYQSLQL